MSFTIEQLKGDLQLMSAQRDQTLIQYHQHCGSISMLEAQIKFLENKENKESEEIEVFNIEPEMLNEEPEIIE